jgi:hypothetical protein
MINWLWVARNAFDAERGNHFLQANFVRYRWSRLRHEATLSNSKVFFHALRTSVPSLGTDVLFQLFGHATHDPFRIRPASGIIQSRVALRSTASAQLDAAPSHH